MSGAARSASTCASLSDFGTRNGCRAASSLSVGSLSRSRSRTVQRKKRRKTVRRRFALVAALPAWRAAAYSRRSVSLASTSARLRSRASQSARSVRSRRYAASVFAASPSSIQSASPKRSIVAALAAWLAAALGTATSRRCASLLELQLLRRDDLLVDVELGGDVRRELLRRVADDDRAGVLDALLHRRIVERLAHRVVDLVDDVLRQPLGPVDAVVRRPVDRLEADLLERRNVGQHGETLRRRDDDRDEAAFLDEGKRRRQVVEHDRHLSGDDVVQRRARASIRDVDDERPREVLVELHLQVADAAGARARVRVLPRVLL